MDFPSGNVMDDVFAREGAAGPLRLVDDRNIGRDVLVVDGPRDERIASRSLLLSYKFIICLQCNWSHKKETYLSAVIANTICFITGT